MPNSCFNHNFWPFMSPSIPTGYDNCEASLSSYVNAILTGSEYFTINLDQHIDDSIIRKMIKCCSNLGYFMQAAVLCQVIYFSFLWCFLDPLRIMPWEKLYFKYMLQCCYIITISFNLVVSRRNRLFIGVQNALGSSHLQNCVRQKHHVSRCDGLVFELHLGCHIIRIHRQFASQERWTRSETMCGRILF